MSELIGDINKANVMLFPFPDVGGVGMLVALKKDAMDTILERKPCNCGLDQLAHVIKDAKITRILVAYVDDEDIKYILSQADKGMDGFMNTLTRVSRGVETIKNLLNAEEN